MQVEKPGPGPDLKIPLFSTLPQFRKQSLKACLLLGEKLVWDLMVISENGDSLLPPQPSPCPVLLPKDLWLKISSHFGSQGKCEVGLDCLEFSSLQTVWVSEVPSFLTEGWCACPTNPGGHSLGSRDSNDLIPVKGVGSERPERLVGDILGRTTGWIASVRNAGLELCRNSHDSEAIS